MFLEALVLLDLRDIVSSVMLWLFRPTGALISRKDPKHSDAPTASAVPNPKNVEDARDNILSACKGVVASTDYYRYNVLRCHELCSVCDSYPLKHSVVIVRIFSTFS